MPSNWSTDRIAARQCGDRNHIHLSRRQVWELEQSGLIEWVLRGGRHEKGVIRQRRIIPVRGLSCRVGAALVEALGLGAAWARTMLADIESPIGF